MILAINVLLSYPMISSPDSLLINIFSSILISVGILGEKHPEIESTIERLFDRDEPGGSPAPSYGTTRQLCRLSGSCSLSPELQVIFCEF